VKFRTLIFLKMPKRRREIFTTEKNTTESGKKTKTDKSTYNKKLEVVNNYFQCPAEFVVNKKVKNQMSLFLAGGISNCPDWQSILQKLIHAKMPELVLINPRRLDFDISDPTMTETQINWEFRHLLSSSAVSFYFPPETLCPITLFELGKWSSAKRIFICCHPKYARREDVIIQIGLIRKDVKVVDTLEDLSEQIVSYFMSHNKK